MIYDTLKFFTKKYPKLRITEKKLVVNSVKNSNRLASFSSKPQDFGSHSNCWKYLGQSGITVPSGECLGCGNCALGQCEGSLGIFLGQTLGCKTFRFFSLGFAQGKSWGSPGTAPQHSVGTRGTLLRGQLFHSAPRIFNSCSDYQFHEVYWQIKLVFTLYYSTVLRADTVL